MMILFGILISFCIFSFIVIIHEYGHFKTARFFGVKVDEFGLGIPPRAKKIWTDKQGTLYSLNWLPIGGFVKIAGESPKTFLVFDENKKPYNNKHLEKDIRKDKNIYNAQGEKLSQKDIGDILSLLDENNKTYNLFQKPAWQQSIVILAGVFMNFLLAFFIFTLLFLYGVKPIGVNNTLPLSSELKLIPSQEQALESGLLKEKKGVILFPVKNSVAENAGIKDGDVLLRINDKNFGSIEEVQKTIATDRNTIKELYIERTELCANPSQRNTDCPSIEYLEIRITPASNGKIGAYLSPNIIVNTEFSYKYGLADSIKYGFLETSGQIHLTFVALKSLAGKIFFPETPVERKEAVKSLSGPIGIVDFISNSISAGVVFLIILTAIISINLGVFNLLPIPALDGGRFLFILINALLFQILGKKGLSYRIENSLHVFFFMILIALSIFIAYNDVVKILDK